MNFDYKEDNYDFNVDMPNKANVFEKYIYKNSIPTLEGTETNPIDLRTLDSGLYIIKGYYRITDDDVRHGSQDLFNIDKTDWNLFVLGSVIKLSYMKSWVGDTPYWELTEETYFTDSEALNYKLNSYYTKSEVDAKVISTLEGTTSNPINAWELEEGIYIIKGTYSYKQGYFRTKLVPEFLRVEVVESGGQTIKMVSNDEFEIDGYAYSNGTWNYLQTIKQYYTKDEIDNMIGNIETLLGGI